jgi:hypothetical protein
VAAARATAHALAIAAADEAEAVVLDLVRSGCAGRHRATDGRQARLDEAGEHGATITGASAQGESEPLCTLCLPGTK